MNRDRRTFDWLSRRHSSDISCCVMKPGRDRGDRYFFFVRRYNNTSDKLLRSTNRMCVCARVCFVPKFWWALLLISHAAAEHKGNIFRVDRSINNSIEGGIFGSCTYRLLSVPFPAMSEDGRPGSLLYVTLVSLFLTVYSSRTCSLLRIRTGVTGK